jgi:K+-sensing histidine kinase KdpD
LTTERVSYVVHELRSPLAVVTGYTSFLLDDGAGPLDSEQREILDRVRRSLTALERLIADLSDFARTLVSAPADASEEVALDGFLREAADLVVLLSAGAEVAVDDLRRAGDLEVLGDPILARQCLPAVAAWVARGSARGRITALASAEGGEVVVSFRSTGLQAPPDLAETLADPLAPVPGLCDAAAWRLGLAAAATRLAHMGGRLEVTRAGDDLVVALHFRRTTSYRGETGGSRTVKVEPRPTSLSTSIAPPSVSTSRRTM